MEKIFKLSLILSFAIIETALCHPDYGKKCPDSKSKRLFGKTSDRDLFGPELEISSVGRQAIKEKPIDYDHPSFYDPNYGFSKEVLADIGITERPGESKAEESVLSPDVVPHTSGKYFQQHIYTQYPDLLTENYKSALQSGSFGEPKATSYLGYLKNFVDKSKLEDSRLTSPSLDVFTKSNTNDFDQYLKEAYKKYEFPSLNQDFAKLLRNPKEESFSDAGRYLWQAANEGRPYRQHYNLGKEPEDNKYLSEFLEQSRALNEYFQKFANSAEYELGESDEFNGPKFREGDRPVRSRRPPGRNNSPRQAPGRIKLCVGSRCGNKIRRPRFIIY